MAEGIAKAMLDQNIGCVREEVRAIELCDAIETARKDGVNDRHP